MSYILDALNKSEQERHRNQLPGLRAPDDEPTRYRPGLKHFAIVAILLIIANTIGVYLYFGDRINASRVPAPTAVPEPLLPTVPAATPFKPAEESPPLMPAKSIRQPVPIELLPVDIQARIPPVTITAHIYAADAELRMVRINGSARGEGELIGPNHRIREITETGLILDFEDYAYLFDIVQDWQTEP